MLSKNAEHQMYGPFSKEENFFEGHNEERYGLHLNIDHVIRPRPVYSRCGGEQSEYRFCENKCLAMPTLRMTSEAKV